MSRFLLCLAPLAVVFLAGLVDAQGQIDHPHLRAALHELREARQSLQKAKDVWPPGYRERALASTQGAIDSVRKILDVRNLDSFVGVDRSPDYYKRYADHQRLRAALHDLREAREELRIATVDFRGLKDRALEDIEVAIGDILTLIRNDKR